VTLSKKPDFSGSRVADNQTRTEAQECRPRAENEQARFDQLISWTLDNGLDNQFFRVYRKIALSAYYAPCPCLKDAAAVVEVNNPCLIRAFSPPR
jgi:hypothetical protein